MIVVTTSVLRTDQEVSPSPSVTITPSVTVLLPDAPTRLAVTSVTTSSISLSWAVPTIGLPILSYNLLYHKGLNHDSTYNTGSSDTIAIISGLDPNTTYLIRVQGVNTYGEGDISSSVDGTTGVLLPDAPTSLAVTSVTPSSISLSWNEPTIGLPIVSYNLLYHTGSNPDSTYNTGSNTTSGSIPGLDPNTTYSIRVQGVNTYGDGDISSSVDGTTGVLPDAPTSLAVTSVTTSSISLSWNEPTIGLPILSYNLLYHTGFNPDSTYNTGSDTTSSMIPGLDPATTYSIRVQGVNTYGDGDISSSVDGTTSFPPPTYTQAFKVSSGAPGGVWTASPGGWILTGMTPTTKFGLNLLDTSFTTQTIGTWSGASISGVCVFNAHPGNSLDVDFGISPLTFFRANDGISYWNSTFQDPVYAGMNNNTSMRTVHFVYDATIPSFNVWLNGTDVNYPQTHIVTISGNYPVRFDVAPNNMAEFQLYQGVLTSQQIAADWARIQSTYTGSFIWG